MKALKNMIPFLIIRETSMELLIPGSNEKAGLRLRIISSINFLSISGSFLGEHGVPTGRHYPISCTTQPAFERFDPVSCPVAEAAVVDLVSLPMHPHLDAAVVDRICDLVIEHAG